MSLLKLPLLLASSISWHLGLWYPPDADSSVDRIGVMSVRERIWKHAGLPCNLFLRSTMWAVTVAESAVIIGSKLQDTPRLSSHAVSAVLNALGPADASKLTPSFVVGALLVTAGGIVRVQCFRALGPFFTFKQCICKDHQLVTTGPYAVVRHPAYTAMLMSIVGSCMLYGSPDAWLRASGVLESKAWVRVALGGWWVIVAASCVTLFRRTTEEDQMLSEKFGKEWNNWARRVQYKLIPFVY